MHRGNNIAKYFKISCLSDRIGNNSEGKHSPWDVDSSFSTFDISKAAIDNKTHKREGLWENLKI